ncbi:MAG: hypothetical protein ABIW33_01885 [Sphingomicrobium sp.]
MFIDTTDSPSPSGRESTVTVGGVRYPLPQTSREALRDDVRAFAAQLAERRPFTPEFGCEPLFNVEFVGDAFVAYTWRPRFRVKWLRWLGNIKVASNPEQLDDALAYLKDYAAT